MTALTSVSIVFVSTNEGEVLRGALDSLMRSASRHPRQVVVVDNCSSDGTLDEIKTQWPEVSVVKREKRYGLPSNLNQGIHNSDGDYVVLCNSDLVFGHDAIDNLADFLDEHPKAGIAAPRLLGPQGEHRVSARRWYQWRVLLALKGPWRSMAANLNSVQANLYAEWDYSTPKMVDWVPCPATMVRRASLEVVGMMDERFRLYFDDVDLSLRMHTSGWEVWCVPSAEIVHLEQRASIRAFSKQWWWHLSSLAKFAWKHKGLTPRR